MTGYTFPAVFIGFTLLCLNVSFVFNVPLDSSCSSYDFTGPAIDIFVIDRSRSISKKGVQNATLFFRELIARSLVLRPKQNDIGVVTFGADWKPVLELNTGLRECELFLDGGVWSQVQYDDNTSISTSWEGFKCRCT